LESQLKQARQEAEAAKSRSREIQTGLANVYSYLNQESYDQALSLLEKQAESLPDVVVADLRQRAMEGKRRKEDPLYRARLEAERAEQQAQEEQERAYYAELKVEQAREALRQDRLEAARRYLQEALRIHPGDEAAEDLLAEVREKIEEEESRLREILRSAQLALGAGEYEEAMEGFQEYLNQRPGHETASAGLQAARQQQRLAAQRQQARRERIEQLSQQAPVAAEAGRVEEALNLYREWLQLEPDNRSVERSIERIESAEEDRLEEMSEEVAEGDAEMERGELERAIEAYQQALELARLPEEEQFVQRLLEQARGRYEKQQAEQQRRIEAYQEAMARAGELAGDGLFDAALEEANKALALFPDDRDARRMRRDLERALERQGE
jgi:tetratricopeptide (TPR) repeat protein